ncbi:MAG: polysaccharide biosynthesis tyrosine autokinase [Kiritimatiellae bacterium]|nr:polysaccharide biosynthesis tyrosine autokinase [Kiritimatiellia bacterium]MDD5521800.1 polysaccharide biosynthesis tyrosine autokinase [Kiritimatiellia bacterium]
MSRKTKQNNANDPQESGGLPQGNQPASSPVYYGPMPSYYGGGYPLYGGQNGFEDSSWAELAELCRILWLKKFVLLLMLCFSAISWSYYIYSATPIYRAESIVELSVRRPRILGQQDAVIDDTSRAVPSTSVELFNTQVLKLQSNTLRKKVMDKTRRFFPEYANDEEKLAGYFKRNVSIDLIRRSSLVKISVKSPKPETAAAIANMYASEGIEAVYAINRDLSKGAVSWLDSQIAAQRKMLSEAEQKLLDFRQKNLLETLEAQRGAIKESLIAYSKELTEANAERDKLLSRYTLNHPEVKTQDQLLSALKKQYDEKIRLTEEKEKEIASVRTELGVLEREKDTLEVTYRGILARMEEARLSADEKSATIKIIETADIPKKPISPRKMLSLALALFLGGCAGVFLSMLSYKLEDRIWSDADVENDIGLKVLGSVPRTPWLARKKLALIGLKDKFSIAAEAFSGIRGLMDKNSNGKTFLFTSSGPREGKTICSCNVAIMSAKSGMHVLLVDLDMRRPQIARVMSDSIPVMDDNSEWSLLHSLCDAEPLPFSSICTRTELPTLDVVVSQIARDVNPAEVLGTKRLREFLEWAGKNYDRVIIDSPPLGAASDAMVLGGLVDGVVLVFRFNKTKKSIAKRCIRKLNDGGANILGAIINDVDLSRVGHEYGHYYGSDRRG